MHSDKMINDYRASLKTFVKLIFLDKLYILTEKIPRIDFNCGQKNHLEYARKEEEVVARIG